MDILDTLNKLSRSVDIGRDVLSARGAAELIYYRQRFDFSASAVVSTGYTLNLFVAPADAACTVITRVRTVFPSAAMAAYWFTGLLFDLAGPEGTDEMDFVSGGAGTNVLNQNGFLPPDFQQGEFEIAYFVRPGKQIALNLAPVNGNHVNPAMNPVGSIGIYAAKLRQ